MSIAKFRDDPSWRPKVMRNHRTIPGKPVSESLVAGAVQVRVGQKPAKYIYADGRACNHPDGEHHDCSYVTARNRLIPEAERIAYHESRVTGNPMTFPRFFMAAMDRLWQDRNGQGGSR